MFLAAQSHMQVVVCVSVSSNLVTGYLSRFAHFGLFFSFFFFIPVFLLLNVLGFSGCLNLSKLVFSVSLNAGYW